MNDWRFRKCFVVTVCCLVFFLMAPVLMAQTVATTGTIQGTVLSRDAEFLPGARVFLTNLDTGLVRTAMTNNKGLYVFHVIPLGNNYQIEAELEGFGKLTRSGLKVALGSVQTVDLVMELDSVKEVLVVSAEAPIIEVGKSEYTTTIPEESIKYLPINGRDFTDFVQLTPMVAISQERGGISIGGQRGINSNIMMDGADDNSSFFGEQRGGTTPPFTYSKEAIKEFQVINNGFSAMYGKAGGGIVNAVTKSGSNRYEGSLWYFFRDESFVGKDANDEELNTFDQKQYGLALSGPIIKDKVFFFINYDTQDYEISQFFYSDAQQDTFFRDLDGQEWKQTNDQEVFLAKIDWQISPENRASFRWNYAKHRADNGTGGSGSYYAGDALYVIDGVGYPMSNNGLEKDIANSFVAQWSYLFSPVMFNEFRFQYAQEQRPRDAKSVALPETRITGIGTFGQLNFLPNDVKEERYQILENFTYQLDTHELNLGMDYNFIKIDNWFPRYEGGAFYYVTEEAWMNRDDEEYRLAHKDDFRYTQSFGQFDVIYDHWEVGLYVQDDWSVTPDLTFNIGLRYDFQNNPDPEDKNPLYPATGEIPEDTDNIAPRLGFSWDPTGDRKTNIRGGFGIFYGRTPSLLIANALLNNGVTSRRYDVRGDSPYYPDWPNRMDSEPAAGAGKPTLFVFDEDFENPETYRFSVGAEREVMTDLAVSVDYTYAKTKKLERKFNANLKPSTETDEEGRVMFDKGDVNYSDFYQIITFKSDAESDYNAVNLKATKRFSNNWSVLASYTYAMNKDNDSNERSVSTSSQFPTNQYDLEDDYSWANFDIRHQFVMSGVYRLPFGFTTSGVFRYVSGQPYSALTGSDNNNDGFYNDRPIGYDRNSERQPDFKTFDLRVSWALRFYQSHEIEIIAEVFNLFDWSNREISYDRQKITSDYFGEADLAGDPRQFQLGLRYSF